jgi:hypothetical protein
LDLGAVSFGIGCFYESIVGIDQHGRFCGGHSYVVTLASRFRCFRVVRRRTET